jgi:capsular exopolysaccharide synthesis family protein
VLVLAIVIGLPLGAGGALGLELLDDRIKSPDDIKAHLGIRFLGFAPAIPRKMAESNTTLGIPSAPAEFEEALRTVRANLFMNAPRHGTKTVLLTSTGPGEGKTRLAADLAIALARARLRVLLVDADMRRPGIHKIFNERRVPGLAGVLAGEVPMDDAVRPSEVSGLSLLTAGVASGSPGDLLQLDVLEQALGVVRDRFDWIVIDSPPVMVASDAKSLSDVASAVIFVVGAQMTTRANAIAALEQLDGARGKIIGAVLSRGTHERYSPYSKYSTY